MTNCMKKPVNLAYSLRSPPLTLKKCSTAAQMIHYSFEATLMIFSAELEIKRSTKMTTIPLRFSISALSENGDCLAAKCMLMVRGLPILIPEVLYSSR